MIRRSRELPFRVAHLTTVDMSLELLLRAQLDGAVLAGAEVIGISAPGPWVQGLVESGIRHEPLTGSTRGMNVIADLRAASQLFRVLRRTRPTILHTHNPKPGVYGRIVGRLARVPIVVNTVHGLYATEDDAWQRRAVVYGLERVASTFSDAELVQNVEDVHTMRRFRLAGRRKTAVLGNGVRLNDFVRDESARGEMRTELGVGDTTVVVGVVGRLVAEKGYPELFEAMACQADNVRLVVVGPDDPEKADALSRDMIGRARAAGVQFLGMRPDVARLLNAFDVFVLPSHREGFPRSAMEAAANSLPVIATDIRGCRQVVDEGVNGFLVPVNDVARLAAAIRRVVADAALRDDMGQASLRKAREQFDDATVVRRVMDTYSVVAKRKRITLRVG